MNQAGCACAYVYDCCKLLRVFSAPVYPDRHRRLTTLSSSRSHRLPSSPRVFFHSTFPSLDHFFFCRPAAPASSSEGCTSSSGSSNVLFILFIESTRRSTKLYSTSRVLTRMFLFIHIFLKEFCWCYEFSKLY